MGPIRAINVLGLRPDRTGDRWDTRTIGEAVDSGFNTLVLQNYDGPPAGWKFRRSLLPPHDIRSGWLSVPETRELVKRWAPHFEWVVICVVLVRQFRRLPKVMQGEWGGVTHPTLGCLRHPQFWRQTFQPARSMQAYGKNVVTIIDTEQYQHTAGRPGPDFFERWYLPCSCKWHADKPVEERRAWLEHEFNRLMEGQWAGELGVDGNGEYLSRIKRPLFKFSQLTYQRDKLGGQKQMHGMTVVPSIMQEFHSRIGFLSYYQRLLDTYGHIYVYNVFGGPRQEYSKRWKMNADWFKRISRLNS